MVASRLKAEGLKILYDFVHGCVIDSLAAGGDGNAERMRDVAQGGHHCRKIIMSVLMLVFIETDRPRDVLWLVPLARINLSVYSQDSECGILAEPH